MKNYRPRIQSARNIQVKKPVGPVQKVLNDILEGLSPKERGEVEAFAQWFAS